MKRTAFLLLGFACAPFSLVYSPRVAVDGQPDFYSLETIVESVAGPGMTQAQKAVALWKFVISRNFHYKSAEEGFPDARQPFEMNTLYEPLKILNSYGYCYCFSNVSLMQGLWRAAGFDSTRVWGIGGHLIAEVYYDSGWHYYDGDQSVSSYFLSEDGKRVASVAELQDNAEKLVVHPEFRGDPSMPYDAKPFYVHEARRELAAFLSSKADNYMKDVQCRISHGMDYYLRRGESLTLFFEKQGKWRHNGMDWHNTNPVNGPYDPHTDRTYSNGLFEYVPDLSDSSILREGFYSSSNITVNGALTLADSAKDGEIVIKTLSPYVITGTPVNPCTSPEKPVRYTGAAVLSGRLEGKGPVHFSVPLRMEVSVSTDKMQGAFKTVYAQDACGFFKADLSECFSAAAYYYLVKITLKGRSDRVKAVPFIDSLRLRTWVQVNPLSVPKLFPGANSVRYFAGGPQVDKVNVEREYNAKHGMEYLYASRNVVNAGADKPSREFMQKDTLRPGVLVFELASREGEMHDYTLAALLAMRENMATGIFRSENDTLHWVKVDYPVKKYHDHWSHWVTSLFTPDKPVRKAYFKFVITGGASVVCADFSYRYKYRAPSGTVFSVHGAEVDGKMREFRNELKGEKGAYRVTVKGKKVVNRFLRYECR